MGCSNFTVNHARHRLGMPAAPRGRQPRRPEFPLDQRHPSSPVPDNLLALWREYHLTPTPTLRNALIERYAHLVRFAAERMHVKLPAEVDLDDLISAGTFGLMDAIEKFDLDRGVKFETYCGPRIRGAILDELRSMDFVPRLVRSRSGKLNRAVAALTAEFDRQPTDEEVRERLNVSPGEFAKIRGDGSAVGVVSLSRKLFETDSNKDFTEADSLRDPSPSPTAAPEDNDALDRILRGLDRQKQLIVRLYFYQDMRMKEIGRTLGLSESRVSQILTNLMSQFRARFTYDQARELLCA
jgi:RNA polymerase sigma factor for flagellar operon FliA